MRVFVGTSHPDLQAYREAAFRQLRALKSDVVSDGSVSSIVEAVSLERYLAPLEKADIFLILLGDRYGPIAMGADKSSADIEFERAKKLGIEIVACVLADDSLPAQPVELEPVFRAKLEAFRFQVFEIAKFVRSVRLPEDVGSAIASSFNAIDAARGQAASPLSGSISVVPPSTDTTKEKSQGELRVSTLVSVAPIWRGRGFQQHDSSCFVLLPFREPFFQIFKEAVAPTIEELGMRAFHGDEIFSNREIVEDIWKSICTARLIVADVTGRNANVFYELGICHTLGKECVILTQNRGDVPFDIRHRRFIEYTPDNLGELKFRLRQTIDNVLLKDRSPDRQVDP